MWHDDSFCCFLQEIRQTLYHFLLKDKETWKDLHHEGCHPKSNQEAEHLGDHFCGHSRKWFSLEREEGKGKRVSGNKSLHDN